MKFLACASSLTRAARTHTGGAVAVGVVHLLLPMLRRASNAFVRSMRASRRGAVSSRSRLRASNVIVTDGGVKFRLVDHFHRRHDFEGVALRLWLLMFLVGVIATVVAIGVDLLAKDTYEARAALCNAMDSMDRPAAKWGAWLGSAGVCSLIATALLQVVPAAAGSGLPEVKMLLGGIVLFESFTLRALLIKPISLALALASSLSIGKEGPFIHCACIVAFRLVNARWMRFSTHVLERREIEGLVAACAAGVVCTFGAPVGGVLFAAEITTGAYSIEHLPRGFFCVTLVLVFEKLALRPLLLAYGRADPLALFTTSFEPHDASGIELAAFALQVRRACPRAECVAHARLHPCCKARLLPFPPKPAAAQLL